MASEQRLSELRGRQARAPLARLPGGGGACELCEAVNRDTHDLHNTYFPRSGGSGEASLS